MDRKAANLMASSTKPVTAASSGDSYSRAICDHSSILGGTGACLCMQLVIWLRVSIDVKNIGLDNSQLVYVGGRILGVLWSSLVVVSRARSEVLLPR